MDKGDSFQKAKEYAFFLLKFRLRSEEELRCRLKKKFPEAVINATLRFLKENNFIDDKIFVKEWIDARLKKPFGIRRIVQELRLKGVADSVIQETLDRIKGDYSETQVVQRLAKEKLEALKDCEPLKAKRKVSAYLLRRGFSAETVYEVLNNLCRQTC
ncbi:MAG: recombination regulator RecX [Candidatus Omnitrophica bacterium]|nr:recombination regulator RecX [Candidatus Omnitrophota bacterium]